MNIADAVKANRQSAKDNGWGVLPDGPYVGVADPALLPDIAAVNRISFDTIPGPAEVVSKDLVELLKNADQVKTIRETAKGNPAALRFLDNVDLSPKTTMALNAGLAVAAVGGAVADRMLVERPAQLVK